MPPPPAPSPVPLPLAGRLILITGGNGTIAAATAVAVARRGAAVVLGCRRPDAGAATVRAVLAAVPAASVRSHPLDLGCPASVAAFAAAASPPAARPAALLNAAATGNLAGVSLSALWRALTRRPMDGGTGGGGGGGGAAGRPPPALVVNAVGVAALTAAVVGGGGSSPPPLVINLSSRAHRQAHLPSLLRALGGGAPPGGVAGAVRAAVGYFPYADAKLANLLAVRAAAAASAAGGGGGRGGGGAGVAVAVHPGVVASGLFPAPVRAVLRALPRRLRSAVGGREPAVVGEELADLLQRGLTGGGGGQGGLVHGGYYVPGGRLGVVGNMVTPAAVRSYVAAMDAALVACGFVEPRRGGGGGRRA